MPALTRTTIAVLVLLCASRAAAQPPEAEPDPASAPVPVPAPAPGSPILPAPFVERPLTLRELVFRLDARVIVSDVEDLTGSSRTTFATFAAGAAVGVLDDFELGAVVAPVLLVPEVRYLDPSLYALVRYLSGVVDLGAQLTLRAPVEEGSAAAILAGLPVLVHAAPWFRLDVVPQIGTRFTDDVELTASLPLTATFQILPSFFAGTSVGCDLVGVEGFDEAHLTASAFFGGTIARANGPTADLGVSFLLPSVTDGLRSFSVVLTASFYVYAK